MADDAALIRPTFKPLFFEMRIHYGLGYRVYFTHRGVVFSGQFVDEFQVVPYFLSVIT
jgi:hypothetical protein